MLNMWFSLWNEDGFEMGSELSNLDEHPKVKEFLMEENPNVEQTRIAYSVRDAFYGLSGKDYLMKHLNKLGYTPEKINDNYNNQKRKFMIENLNSNVNLEELWEESEDCAEVLNLNNQKMDRYNYLKDYVEGRTEDFYNELDEGELVYLGW